MLVLVVASASFAQSGKVDQQKMVKESADPVKSSFYQDYQNVKNSQIKKVTVVGEVYAFTDYDYSTNNSMRPMVDWADFDGDGDSNPIVTAMVRQNAGNRDQMLGFGDVSGFAMVNAFDAGLYGWGSIQYMREGPDAGNVFILTHSGGVTHGNKINAETQTVPTPEFTTPFGVNYPSFVYTNDGTIWATTTDGFIYKSVDGGATFTQVIAIGSGDPNANIAGATGVPAEVPIQATDDGQIIVVAGAYTAAGLAAEDIVYLYYSEDAGATWSGQIIGVDAALGQVSNRPDYKPYFENFGQITLVVDNMGVIHVAANGYGEGATVDDVVIPALYWNSTMNTWMAMTDPDFEVGNAMVDPIRIYSGNALGNAYPGVTVSDNGQVIFYAWQAPEYDGANFRIYPGDGSAETGPIVYTDIKAVYSVDGGTTWSDIMTIAGDPEVMEQYPNLPRRIEADYVDGVASVHMVFMNDKTPGAAIFIGQVAGQNSLDNTTEWLYYRYDFDIPTDVNDPSVVVDKFELAQNYPNPFNPSTTINFSLAKSSDVSLKVYDMLGKEVATIVNGSMNQGSHQVTFDASDLASGLYVYTIRTADFVSSKKMMLMK